jgi:hypothetical protein
VVYQDGVRRDAVEAQICERTPRLVDDDPRGVHHQPGAGAIDVQQDLPDIFDIAIQAVDGFEDRFGRHEAADPDAVRERSQHVRGPALPVEEVLHEEAQHVRQAQQPQGRARRRAIDDTHVELARLLDLLHRTQGDELLHPRKDEQLFGHHFVSVVAEQLLEEPLDLRP